MGNVVQHVAGVCKQIWGEYQESGRAARVRGISKISMNTPSFTSPFSLFSQTIEQSPPSLKGQVSVFE